MQIETSRLRSLSIAAVACMACAPAMWAQVQAGPTLPATTLLAVNDGPKLDLTLPTANGTGMDLARQSGVTYSSSSDTLEAVDADAAGRLDLAVTPDDATQPPPRRRYGRPRYNDNSHNADGSSKYGFLAGAGFTAPTGNTYHYLNTNYAFQVGAGRNFSKKFSVFAQFDYDRFGFNGPTLFNQESLYNYYCPAASAAAGVCTQFTTLDGNSHVWSFSLNPTFNFYSREGLGAYVVVGVGFYHKVANFTTPEQGIAFSPFYGYYSYVANANVDHYTSNAPGFNGGIGLTFKPSRFSNQRLYAEARYVFVDNSQRTGVTAFSSTATLNAYNGNDLYPQNSNRTTYLPIKFGIRF